MLLLIRRVMSHVLGGCMIFSVCAAEPFSSLLDYDFTQPVISRNSRFAAPVFHGKPTMTAGQQALGLDGKSYLEVPGSETITLEKDSTLYAVVNFAESGSEAGANDAHDMIFFKAGEFLLGRNAAHLYFNVGNGQTKATQWQMTTYAAGIPTQRWTSLAAVVQSTPKGYVVRLYIDGVMKNEQAFNVFYQGNQEPVTIGKGWGGPWFMLGKIAQLKIFDWALNGDQIAALAATAPYMQK